VKREFFKFMLDIAERLVLQRRLKIRMNKYQEFKEIMVAKLEINDKYIKLDKIIEAEYKYFGHYSKNTEKELE
jgi:hypothetical protein